MSEGTSPTTPPRLFRRVFNSSNTGDSVLKFSDFLID
jgi:hypothetical protein